MRLAIALALAGYGLIVALAAPANALAAGSISGTVTDAGTALAVKGVLVCAYLEGEEEEFEEECTHSAADGGYTIAPLPAGEYAVEFWASVEGLNYVYEAYDNEPVWYQADLVAVASGPVTGIDAELSEGGEIHGTVVNANGGAPVAAVMVCAYPIDEGGVGSCDLTDATGAYADVGLATDTYEVTFYPEYEDLDFIRQIYNGKTAWWEADPVEVTVGAVTTNVNAALQEGAQISGTVVDASSHAGIGGVEVCAFEAAEVEFAGCALTAAGGHYAIKRLAADAFKVGFALFEEEEGGEYLAQFYDDVSSWEAATVVPLAAGSTTAGIDAALRKVPAKNPPQLPNASLPAPSVMQPKPSALRCRRGFKKQKVRGKVRCVKVHRHRKHHPGGKGGARIRTRLLDERR